MSASDGTLPGKIAVTWGAVSGATGYDVQYRIGTGAWSAPVAASSGWQLSTSDESTYEFQVRAKNAVGTGNWSGSDTGFIAQSCATQTLNWGGGNYCGASAATGTSGTTRPLSNAAAGASGSASALCTNGTWAVQAGSSCSVSLAVPSGIAATDGTLQGKIALTWPAIAGASSYDVQHRKGGGAWNLVSGVASGWEWVTTDRSDIEFQVRATNALGNGAWSASDTGYIARTCAAATLSWGASNFCSAAVAVSQPDTSQSVTNSAAGASGGATASCDGMTGQWSVSNTSCSVSLAAPSALTATQGTIADKVQASWPALGGASGYDVQYRAIGASDWTAAPDVASGLQVAIADVSDYEFQLRAKNVLGLGPWSASATGWIQRCAAAPLQWGVASLCGATPALTKTGGQLTLASSVAGASGSVTASCAAGSWQLTSPSCVIAMNLDATDGTREDDVALSWSSSIDAMSGLKYDVYRVDDKIASALSARTGTDVPPERGTGYTYKVQAILSGQIVGEATATGSIPACRAARLIGASLNADMSAINGLIEQWDCLGGASASSAIDTDAPAGMAVTGEKAYRSFSVPVPVALKDGAHTLHLGLASDGVAINAQRTYDVPFTLDRASIAVKNLTITYKGSGAVDGLEADSVGRFGVRMEGGSGIGFAEEVK